jgi:type VI secretion system protein ImpL
VLNFLSDNTAIVTLLLLTLLVLSLLAVIVWAAMKGAEKQDQPAHGKPRLISTDSLKQSFRSAVELIESNLAVRSERYNLSWTLILNEGQAGRELPLVQSGLQSALSADSTLTAAAQGISWNFFDKGIAVQLQSDFLGSPDPDAPGGNNTWDDFLGLCRNYRPDRPFDSIVIAIPASLFLQSDPEGQLDLAARAKAIHRRLWLAQNRLALRFPVYLTISDCESIPGFAAFSKALPEPMRRSMLGWSSPYELVAPFQAQWVDAAMNEIVRSISDSCAELCALEPADSDSIDYFMLPNEMERLRAGLKLFAEELMRPSAYHEPFLLRGIYLTGDCSDAAALLAGGHAVPAMSLPQGDDVLSPSAADWPGAGLELESEPDLLSASALATWQASAVPAFLRDLFERKIFAEVGLVRSSSLHSMRRPALNRLFRWALIVLPIVWLVGLGLSSVRLHRLNNDVVLYLERLDHDSRESRQARSSNVIDPAQSKARTMDALLNIERMDSARLSSPFMPGSWQLFDDLHDRLQRRLEKGFADNSFEPMRRSVYSQVSELTGVPLDLSGALISGASCTLPAQWHQHIEVQRNNALNLEDLPEFSATLQYVARVEELDKVLRAMMRLKATDIPASGDDLALVVRGLLGAELNGDTTRTAELFRQVAQGVASMTIEPLQDAASCSLRLALNATYERLFANNGLLKSEQAIARSAAALLDARPRSSDADTSIESWQTLQAILRNQESFLVTGKGAWMHGRTLQLGSAHEGLLQKIQTVSLLAKMPVSDAKRQAQAGFVNFLASWDAITSVDSYSQSLDSGLAWSATTMSWTFSPERKALLEALSALLSQSYMRVNHFGKFPDVPAGATVSWDRVRLDHALALSDARKRFQVESLGKFPAMLQTPVAALVDAALAETARDLMSQAILVSSNEIQAPATQADRMRTLRLTAWLQELGAEAVADNLSSVLATDALARLKFLDDTFNRAQVFVPRDREFRSWNGEKVPLLDAFGAGDASNLAAYVSQQQSFIDTAGRDAEGLLQQLGREHAGNALVARWQAMVSDLNRYRLKSPTSSLMSLEQFVLSGAAELDMANCMDKLSSRIAQHRATDVFAERLQALQVGLHDRCRAIKHTQYQDVWTRFSDAFNRDLAHRFPFRAWSADPAFKVTGMERSPADVDDVGATLKLFDRSHAAALASGRNLAKPPGSSAVRKADEQMQKVRDFFAPLFPTEENQVAGMDLMVEFRANASAEIHGNKIIDWALTVGNQTLHQRDPARPLRWEPGLPIAFSMRVARDGPVLPKAEPGRGAMSVDDVSVTYRFDDPWALITFIAMHRELDAPAGTDARSQLLRFEFPVVSSSENIRIAPKDARAKVFVRVHVSAAGKRTPLTWPGVFPTRIPTW